jgi:hypothetical protein
VTARAAQAQASQPQIQVQLEADTVGVGDVVHLQVSVTSADEMPSDVQIGATPGFVVRGQNESPSQTHIIANGSRMDRYTLTVDWSLQAQRTGTFSVGPLTALVGGSRYAAQRVTIHVVSAGQAPHRARQQRPDPFGSSPFDPFRGFFPGFDDGSQQQQPSAPTVNVDPRLSLEAPGGSYFFLHATVDKTGAAVGEQVTYTVYEYADTSAGDIEVDADAVHDPQAADFVKHPLVPEDQEAPVAGYASIGGRIWLVKIVRRWALFPPPFGRSHHRADERHPHASARRGGATESHGSSPGPRRGASSRGSAPGFFIGRRWAIRPGSAGPASRDRARRRRGGARRSVGNRQCPRGDHSARA